MDDKNTNIPRVVRTGPKTTGKRNNKKSKGVPTVKSIIMSILKIFTTIVLVFTITGCIVGTALTIYVMEFVNSDATININNVKMNFTTNIYGIDGNGKFEEVKSLSNGDNRIWVDIGDVPQHVQDAFVFSEDERFNTHQGVDFKRTFLAFANELLTRVGINTGLSKFGASTITQQLIKNINGDFEDRGYDKKLQEIIQALNMERHTSKPQILELYLNYVGLNYASGVQAGAKYFFNKDVADLSYAQAAALAATTKSPVTFNPKDNPEGNKKRRNDVVLKKMLEFNAITQAEYDTAIKEEIVIANPQKPTTENPVAKKKQSYFVDAVMDQVIADLSKEYNYSKEEAGRVLASSGYQVYTTMEIKTQEIVEKYFVDENTFAVKGVNAKDIPQASMVLLDYDGNIRALVGGKGEKTVDRGLNRATQSKRPAGSTIKPLAIYTPAFESGIINWSSMMEDSKAYDREDGTPYPYNYDKKFTHAPMTIIDALKVSKNTIPVKLCLLLTPQVCFDFVYNELGLHSLVATGPYNNVGEGSMALGDGGVKLTELTASYQIFGNGGYFTEPRLYTKVTDASGKIILDTTAYSKKQVMSPQTAYIMNKGLLTVVNEGSGKAGKLDNYETIGKTGTSNDRRDLLFMGATPYYIAGIRYGHDDNSYISDGIKSGQIPVWKKIMTAVHEGKNPAKFELSNIDIVEFEYCQTSGKLAQAGCPKKGKGYYNTDSIPDTCDVIHGEAS